MHVGGGPHELHDLDRLVGGSVLSEADGVVGHHVQDTEPRQSAADRSKKKKTTVKKTAETRTEVR